MAMQTPSPPIVVPVTSSSGRAVRVGGGPTDPSHDENLRRGILHTDVARPVAMSLVMIFIAAISLVPVAQAVRDKVAGEPSVLLDLFRHAPTKDNLRQFEQDLDGASTPREWARAHLQTMFVRLGHFGNGKVVVGRTPGWLFYGPGVTAVGGLGFLDPGVQATRQKDALDAGNPPLFPDPRPAILDFSRYLARRGIRLVIFPVPDKASLQPRELHGRSADMPAKNPDADRFVADMRREGIVVFDPTPSLLPDSGSPIFLQQDTHWTPAWMESVARALASSLEKDLGLPRPATPRHFAVRQAQLSRLGDLTDMLRLPPGQTLLAPESVTLHEIHDPVGKLFEPSEDAQVLLLGDSFTNVFSLDQMGWGEGAGFAAQLAKELGRDVDVIAQNDAGASATRQLLANALAAAEPGAPDRLANKRVVVWEFASRELAVGNWKPIAWPSGATPPPPERPAQP